MMAISRLESGGEVLVVWESCETESLELTRGRGHSRDAGKSDGRDQQNHYKEPPRASLRTSMRTQI